MTHFHTLKIKEKSALTSESVSITFDIPKELKDVFSFKPGQFVMVEKEINGETLRRYYSIYSSIGKAIKLGIKVKKEDGFTNYVKETLQVGDTLQVAPPMDDVKIDLSQKNKNYLGITIGSGITPFFSIIQSIIQKSPTNKFVLIYGNHAEELTMFYNELKQLATTYPKQFSMYLSYSSDTSGDFTGRINSNTIQDVLTKESLSFDAVFMIGPDSLKKMAAKALEQNGIAPSVMKYRVYS